MEIKICGLTLPEEAAECAELGADAIGMVFFPKSPRHLTPDMAKAICLALPQEVARVGVFVNAREKEILQIAEECGLTWIQLHGNEAPGLAENLSRAGFGVIKAFFSGKKPDFSQMSGYPADAFLVECGKGFLPGGNAITWNWEEARGVSRAGPLILAGGLCSDNVEEAVSKALPEALDLSSGVEASPGRKDPDKVRSFIEKARKAAVSAGKDKSHLSVFCRQTKPDSH